LADIYLESTDKKALFALVDEIKNYGNDPYNFYSTMEIDPQTDLATIAKIKDHCLKTLGLVDV